MKKIHYNYNVYFKFQEMTAYSRSFGQLGRWDFLYRAVGKIDPV